MRTRRTPRTMAILVATAAAIVISAGLAGTANAAPNDVVGGPGASADPGAQVPLRLTIAPAFGTQDRWTVSGTFQLPPGAPFSCQLPQQTGDPNAIGFEVVLAGSLQGPPGGFPFAPAVAPDSCVRTAYGVDLRVSRLKERSTWPAQWPATLAVVRYYNGHGGLNGPARNLYTNAVRNPAPPVASTGGTTP